jgi:Glyoxalase-like domain
MIEIDHICLGVRNIYKAAHRLREETGLGNYDGGWFPEFGLANRIVPLGGDVYIEIEGVVDAYALHQNNPTAKWFDGQVSAGDVFIGWCARVTTRTELDAIAKRLGASVIDTVLRVRPDGSSRPSFRVPDTAQCWNVGRPNFFYTPDMAFHASRQPIGPGPGITPRGLAWMEIGGSSEDMSEWLGVPAESLGLRCNGQAAGLYAIGIKTDAGEIEIRRPPSSRLVK